MFILGIFLRIGAPAVQNDSVTNSTAPPAGTSWRDPQALPDQWDRPPHRRLDSADWTRAARRSRWSTRTTQGHPQGFPEAAHRSRRRSNHGGESRRRTWGVFDAKTGPLRPSKWNPVANPPATKWRRGELNPRPRAVRLERLRRL